MTNTEQVTDFKLENATIADVIKGLNRHLKSLGVEPEEYGFTSADHREKTGPWKMPGGSRWLVAFAIEGGSEGYYVHVGAMVPSPKAFWYEAVQDAKKALCPTATATFGSCCCNPREKCPSEPMRKVMTQAHGDDFPATYTYVDFGFCKTYSAESAYLIAKEAQRFLTAAAWN